MILIHQFHGCQEISRGQFDIPQRLVTQPKIVVRLVGFWIDFQRALELSGRMVYAPFLIVDAPQHIGALLVIRMLFEQRHKGCERAVQITRKILEVALQLQSNRVRRSALSTAATSRSASCGLWAMK